MTFCRFTSIVCSLIVLGVGARANASLSQTLILSKVRDSYATNAETPEQRAAGIGFPAVAMSLQAASWVDNLKAGAPVQCKVTALLQDTGAEHSNLVWNVFAVDEASCVPVR